MTNQEGFESENFIEFITELYKNEKFMVYTNDMSTLGGYMGGDTISSFRADIATMIFRHHQITENERKRRAYFNAISTCLRRGCEKRIHKPHRGAYKDYYCSEPCYRVDGMDYQIAKTTELVETGFWEEYRLEELPLVRAEREEWMKKYEQ